MQRDEIFASLADMIAARFDLKREDVTPQTTQSDLGIDSILMVDLMIDVEERFAITFQALELSRNPSLDDIVTLIENNRDR